MDGRWQPISPDSKREVKIILHPTAAIYEVRRGLDPGSDDSIDLSEFVKDASLTAFDLNVTLAFNRELFGSYQPKPTQVIEVQLWQLNEWKSLWIGHIDSINSFSMQRGERQMQLIAKTRDQQDIWRNTPRVTPLFPQLTNLSYIATRIARMTDMKGDEILFPPSALTTAHSNTQLADMTAWDMISSICVALGWTPFIDSVGRLRAANRELQGRIADVILTDDRMIKVGGQRQRSPVNRVRVTWLDPELKKWMQQGKLLTTFNANVGWYMPYWHKTVKFSEDGTLRATELILKPTPGVNSFVNFCIVKWVQQSPTSMKVSFHNEADFASMAIAMGVWLAAHKAPDLIVSAFVPAIPVATVVFGGATVPGVYPVVANTKPAGRLGEMAGGIAMTALMMNIGSGEYEIWGKPYDWVHAKNVSEAFDSSAPVWANNVQDIECDFIGNEGHGRAVCTRELIYSAQAVNKWTVTIVDDPRIEFGDILQFPDGSQLFVEDYTRRLERGTEAVLEVRGFLLGMVRGTAKPVSIVGGTPDIGIGAPGGPGGGPGGGDPNVPDAGDGTPGSSSANPIIAMSSNPDQIRADATASWNHFHPGKPFDNEWYDYAAKPDIFSDGKWYLGWNRYWEDRMDYNNPGYPSHADPGGGKLPSVWR